MYNLYYLDDENIYMQNKRHQLIDDDTRPQKRKRQDLERSLSRLHIDPTPKLDNDVEMEKSGTYEPDKHRIIVYDLDEYDSEPEDNKTQLPKLKVPKMINNTQNMILGKMAQQEGQLVLYRPLDTPQREQQGEQQGEQKQHREDNVEQMEI